MLPFALLPAKKTGERADKQEGLDLPIDRISRNPSAPPSFLQSGSVASKTQETTSFAEINADSGQCRIPADFGWWEFSPATRQWSPKRGGENCHHARPRAHRFDVVRILTSQDFTPDLTTDRSMRGGENSHQPSPTSASTTHGENSHHSGIRHAFATGCRQNTAQVTSRPDTEDRPDRAIWLRRSRTPAGEVP